MCHLPVMVMYEMNLPLTYRCDTVAANAALSVERFSATWSARAPYFSRMQARIVAVEEERLFERFGDDFSSLLSHSYVNIAINSAIIAPSPARKRLVTKEVSPLILGYGFYNEILHPVSKFFSRKLTQCVPLSLADVSNQVSVAHLIRI